MRRDGGYLMKRAAGHKTFFQGAALIVSAAALSGCVSVDPFTDTQTDPTSPVAQRVDEVAASNREYPKWSQFPAVPQNVPTLAEFSSRVEGLEAAQTDLTTSASRLEWTLANTEGWAAQARTQIDPALARPVDPNQAAETEAFARALRELAVPPPPGK
ncbi:MAG TPA: hypothetical protein VD929_10010 [Caulobacteraceae bacterium]|nr:hypothetical protein [Caulobacteraceae bacterium]